MMPEYRGINQHRQQGISLIEITAVVAILAIIAGVALPDLGSGSDGRKLDLAAKEVAEAIRFARAEAIRTSMDHGVIFDENNETVKVYSLPAGTPKYDVYHPIDKKLYSLDLNTAPLTAGVDLLSYSIDFGSGPGSGYLGFNSNGNPKFSFFGTDYMLKSAAITLSNAGQTRIINVSPMTGRVTVQ